MAVPDVLEIRIYAARIPSIRASKSQESQNYLKHSAVDKMKIISL